MTVRETNGVILIVDDEPANISMMVGLLEGAFEFVVADDGPGAIEQARSGKPDLILLDVMMPGMDGYEVCRRLKQDSETAHIPVIFVTDPGDAQEEVRGLEVGAVDYVVRPINRLVVMKRVSNHIELKRAHDRLSQLALVDGLTGLANRRCFDQVLEVECRRVRRSPGGFLSLILVDVDHFKRFNEASGHMAGDSCLKRIGAILQGGVRRATDLVARYSGESFVCVLPETPLNGALCLAEQLREGIEALAVAHETSGVAPVVTASFGVVTVQAELGLSPASVVAAADSMLYRAKSLGRNRVAGMALPG